MINMRFVVTGGPGAGKTTVLHALEQDGFAYAPESARAIIKARRAAGQSPRPPAQQFAQQVLAMDIDNYRRMEATDKPVFFDRGLGETLGSLEHSGALTKAEVETYLRQFPYNQTVFILPPWEEIYCTDEERDQTYEHSVRVHGEILGWYQRHGYHMVEVPRLSVADRAAFMLKQIDEIA